MRERSLQSKWQSKAFPAAPTVSATLWLGLAVAALACNGQKHREQVYNEYYYPHLPATIWTADGGKMLPPAPTSEAGLQEWKKRLAFPCYEASTHFAGATIKVVVANCFSGRQAVVPLVFAKTRRGWVLAYIENGVDFKTKSDPNFTVLIGRQGPLRLRDGKKDVATLGFLGGRDAVRRVLLKFGV